MTILILEGGALIWPPIACKGCKRQAAFTPDGEHCSTCAPPASVAPIPDSC